MKKIAIFGSTGSVGTQALQFIGQQENLLVHVLAANQNGRLLLSQIEKFRPAYAALKSDAAYREIKPLVPAGTKLVCGEEEIRALAALPENDIILAAQVGIAGLPVTLAGIAAGKRIALANKEALVTGGALIKEMRKKSKAEILPVDSEHSAIFQCLQGEKQKTVSRLILTASGGPFRDKKDFNPAKVTVEQALSHPNWRMGRKISIDSATLMNKGLEMIEAHWLFGIPAEKIEVVIHPQSIVHSMVEFCDSSVMAQMGLPDMRLPIAYALNYPARLPTGLPRMVFTKRSQLDFYPPDIKRFPCLALAYYALEKGSTMPAVLNAANEVAVDAFLAGKIGFGDIPRILEHTMKRVPNRYRANLEDILQADKEARRVVKKDFLQG